jgi:hypothetical protein
MQVFRICAWQPRASTLRQMKLPYDVTLWCTLDPVHLSAANVLNWRTNLAGFGRKKRIALPTTIR